MLERINKAYKLIDKACKKSGGVVNIMEVSGLHTIATFRSGLRSAFPPGLNLLAGPGCPACVIDQGCIDTIIEISQRPDCMIALDSDTARIPRTANTENMKIVSTAQEALELARQNLSKTVVFVAVGFESVPPATALAVKEAAEQKIENFCILCALKHTVPAMQTILSTKNDSVSAFLCPPDSSAIIGTDVYKPIVEQFARPCVIAGFEPMQIIEAVGEICRQIFEQKSEIVCMHTETIDPKGDETALQMIGDYFDVTDGPWWGLGNVPAGSLKLKAQYSQFDAVCRLDLKEKKSQPPKGCHCGQVLCGLLTPPQCDLFAAKCTPETPIGPCMASSQGTCTAWYKYTKKNR